MATINTYNLPGVYTLYKEGQPPVANTTVPTTDGIVFFGTATDGPVNVPITITRPQDGLSVFGSYPVPQIGSPMLMPAINEAYNAGARDMIAIRISGLDASSVLMSKDTTPVPLVNIFGKYPGARYNNLKFVITATQFQVWNVTDAGLNKTKPSIVYNLADFKNLNLFAAQVNADSNLSDIRITIVEGQENVDPTKLAAVASGKLSGGDDQLAPAMGAYTDEFETGTLRGALANAYNVFVELQTNIVVPLGVYVQFSGPEDSLVYDKTDAYQLASYCYEAARRNNDIIGVIGFQPLADTTVAGVNALTTLLANCDNTFVNVNDGYDMGRYINIVVGEPIFSDVSIGGYANTSGAAYAGLAATLAPQSGTTNKTINGPNTLRYNFAPSQLESLRANKFTVLKYKVGRGIVVVEGLLASLPKSDFQALSTVRIIHAITVDVRNAVDPFIGEPFDMAHVNAIETALRNVISTYAKNGAISSGNFQLYFGQANQIVGDMDVELQLDIPSELRRVIVTVSRRYPQVSSDQLQQ